MIKTPSHSTGFCRVRTEQALAELIGNSIDAIVEAIIEHADIRLNFDKRQVDVTDDSQEMGGGP